MSVQKLDHGEPFNLTGDVASDVPLTSLFWSPTEYSAPLRGVHNRTITFHYGNIATTFMLLNNASTNDTGFFTLSAVTKCGQDSSQFYVDVVHSGKIQFTASYSSSV